ncbi:uncharacterized protein LOC129777726 isoform X2 [Toxorhynchites rutilus septentrionalis]|uniref:uncharacterized protein LOC129777726 isoform X2 n=1 Tax=Toxorhynchites rutilus septentrionalis TaxID=329112 RepID=UPI002479B911|nr:uncharacterized protein LOC129777726 isoform X2 [Toxorhynchites rutilus septentrionalis]
MLMVNANLKEKMLRFQIPSELKDDLVYCQRSLRHFVKVHQLLASKLSNELTQSQVTKLKQYLLELEAEMVEIGNEQRPLIQELDAQVRSYLKQLYSSADLEEIEMAFGYVSRALSVHYEMSFNTKYSPRNVTERLTETQLAHKYELASFDEARPKKEKDESQSSTDSSISPTTIRNQKQISLLKPKEERVGPASKPAVSSTVPPFNNITFSNAKALVNEQVLKKIAPEAIVVPKKLIKILPKSEPIPRPIPKLPEIVTSPVKQEQDDYEPQELPATVAIKKSRLNLLQALNKAKNSCNLSQSQPEEQPKFATVSPRHKGITKVKSDPLPVTSKRASSGASSDSSANSRSSTPISTKASDDSSADRTPPGPIEDYVEPQPTDIAELEQPVFLKFFGLLTLEESKALATRKTERKRRSCNSTERKDFHYGKIDYYEQQSHHITRRRNKRPILYSPPATRGVKKRKHFDTIAATTGAGTTTARSASGSSGSSPSCSAAAATAATASAGTRVAAGDSSKLVLAELESKTCIVCNKSGSADSLSACVYCCNIYHLRCHSNSIFNPQLLRQRDNICPVCLQKKQQDAVAMQNHQRVV